jgi:hypothetical protein
MNSGPGLLIQNLSFQVRGWPTLNAYGAPVALTERADRCECTQAAFCSDCSNSPRSFLLDGGRWPSSAAAC